MSAITPEDMAWLEAQGFSVDRLGWAEKDGKMCMASEELKKRRPDDDGERVESLTSTHLIRGSDVRIQPVRWLRPGVPIGNGSLLAGPPGLAKTTILCEWSARVSRGQMRGDLSHQAADTILMSGEDSIGNTLAPRFAAAGGDLDRVHFVEFGEDGFAVPEDLETLASLVRKLPLPAMVGIDPLMAFVSDRIDSHKDHHIRRAFSAIRAFAEDQHVAVVVVAHLNKGESRDFLNRVNGSVGIGAAVRSAWAVVEHPDDPGDRVLVHTKSNLGPYEPTERFRIEPRTVPGWDGVDVPTSGVVWLGQDPSVTRSNVLEPQEPEERSERDEAADWLRSWLTDGPRQSDETLRAAKADGIAERTLRRAKAKLGVRSNGTYESGKRGARGWTWSLPVARPDLDGQQNIVSSGNLNIDSETAGQDGSNDIPDGLDGHLATSQEAGRANQGGTRPWRFTERQWARMGPEQRERWL